MDLSGVEGLTEAQIASITAAHDADVTGLKSSNTKLMDEAKNAKNASSEKDSVIEEARKAAAKAEEKRLIDAGEYEKAKAVADEELAKQIAESNTNAEKYKNALDLTHLTTAKSGVKVQVLPEFQDAAEALLNLGVSVSYDDNGAPVTTYKHGDKEFNSHSDFLNGVADDPMWSRMLKGADSSGAGTKQSNNSGGASSSSIDKTQSALEQRLKQKGI